MRSHLGFRAAPVAFASVLMLAGCGGSSAPPVVFKPPSYSYLTKLRLNVGDIRIEDQTASVAVPSDLANQAPTPPAQAMRQMAEDRLVAAGTTGTAVFTIDQASITGQPGGTLDGTLAAHLDIIGPSGGHNGYAEAHVSREFVPGAGTDNDGLKSELYNLTNQMMSDMNVELEYQVRRTLGDWLLDASGAPVGAVVEQQTLAPEGAAPTAGSANPGAAGMAPAGPLNLAPAAFPTQGSPTAPPLSVSNSVGAPVQLAPPSGSTPTGVSMPTPMPTGSNTSGPLQLAPPPQTQTQVQSPATPAAGSAAPGAVQGNSPPPGFLRLPNGYLAPSGSAPPNTTPPTGAAQGAPQTGY